MDRQYPGLCLPPLLPLEPPPCPLSHTAGVWTWVLPLLSPSGLTSCLHGLQSYPEWRPCSPGPFPTLPRSQILSGTFPEVSDLVLCCKQLFRPQTTAHMSLRPFPWTDLSRLPNSCCRLAHGRPGPRPYQHPTVSTRLSTAKASQGYENIKGPMPLVRQS